MNEKVEQLTNYIQERCLWQFFSRTWDREENIEGIITQTTEILCGEKPRIETPAERNYYADAKILVSDFKRLFPWIASLEKENIKRLLQDVKDKLSRIAVSESRNEELNDPNY